MKAWLRATVDSLLLLFFGYKLISGWVDEAVRSPRGRLHTMANDPGMYSLGMATYLICTVFLIVLLLSDIEKVREKKRSGR